MGKRGKIFIVLLLPLFAMVVSGLEFETQKAISYYPEEVLEKEGSYARKRCLIDVKWPVGVSNFATVVNFHGGGLVLGARSMPHGPKRRATGILSHSSPEDTGSSPTPLQPRRFPTLRQSWRGR